MMNLKDLLGKLAIETDGLCVTITLPTHRTPPDNATDPIVRKKALRQAHEEVMT